MTDRADRWRGALPDAMPSSENCHASTSCNPGQIILIENLHVKLNWSCAATNEEGYRVYYNDELVHTLSANSNGVKDETPVGGLLLLVTSVGPTATQYPDVKYSIRAFNGSGNSDWSELLRGIRNSRRQHEPSRTAVMARLLPDDPRRGAAAQRAGYLLATMCLPAMSSGT